MRFPFLFQVQLCVFAIYLGYSQRAHSFHPVPTSRDGKCKRNPPCELWDEDMLLEERNRPVVAPVAGQPAPQAVNRLVEALAWMNNPREHLITLRYCTIDRYVRRAG